MIPEGVVEILRAIAKFFFTVGLPVLVLLIVLSGIFRLVARIRSGPRDEALFQSMFPDLQPHFHPQKLVDYVRARMRGQAPPDAAAAQAIAQAAYQQDPRGATLRFGKGKFTVDAQEPRVKYWHPEREFKWQPKRDPRWIFATPMADAPFSSSDRDALAFRDSSSSSTAARAATAFTGAGGTFDGGGASAGWDQASAESSGDKSGAGATAY